MGVEVKVEGLTKSFGRQVIWEDVSLTLPKGEISVLLGPSGTGKSVFLKHLIGLLRPDRGHVYIEGHDVPNVSEKHLYEVRKMFGVLFQDGALFGSMTIYDNVAFPLREHTKKSESDIRKIAMEKLELTGLIGAEGKLPGEISGGMRKRAGLARALVLDPEILLFDEPDSGLDPVRTAYLNQLIVDLNAQIEATMLIVTHDINTARTVPDNIGLLYRRHLAMFGPREMLLSSQEPVVRQFLNARRQGPIGMAEEKDAAELEAEKEEGEELPPLPPIPPQITPSSGAERRTQRPAGSWLKEHNVTPPPGSFVGEGSYATSAAMSTAPPASTESTQDRKGAQATADSNGSGGRGGSKARASTADSGQASSDGKASSDGQQSDEAPKRATKTAATKTAASKTTASKTTASKTTTRKTAAKKTTSSDSSTQTTRRGSTSNGRRRSS